jgi:thiol:disulfide interchange protein DsbC
MLKKLALAMIIGAFSISAYAETETKPATPVTSEQDLKLISSQMKTFFGGDIANYVSETNIPNVYLVTLNDGTNMIYFKDTQYAVVGDMYDLKAKKNMTRSLLANYNADLLATIKDKGIHYPATNTEKGVETVYVFTDPTCGYCRKLNHERADYSANGINLVYMPYSRSGPGTFSYNELVDIFCSGDRVAAMDLAKSDKGEEIKSMPNYKIEESCKNEVKQSQEMGQRLGVTGTPALFTADGHFFPGYVEAPKLRAYIEEAKKK